MKIRNAIVAMLLAAAMVALFLLITAALAVGQTRTPVPAPPIATAQIPFAFWIDDMELPAGEYAIYPVSGTDTLVLLRNMKTHAEKQAFLLPTGNPVPAGDSRLVFVTRNGQHFLREVWKANGKAILTSQAGINVLPTEVRTEVPLSARPTVRNLATEE